MTEELKSQVIRESKKTDKMIIMVMIIMIKVTINVMMMMKLMMK